MKTWSLICSIYLFTLTFVVFIVSIVILLLPVVVNKDTEIITTGKEFIKSNGFWYTLELTRKNHHYIEYMFDPTYENGSLYFASGLNLLFIVCPLFLIISCIVTYYTFNKAAFPIPEKFLEQKYEIKKNKKIIKKKYKEYIKNATTKKTKIKFQNILEQKMLLIKKSKLEIKNKIKMDMKLKKMGIKFKRKIHFNENKEVN